jgi:hypothetical protein
MASQLNESKVSPYHSLVGPMWSETIMLW